MEYLFNEYFPFIIFILNMLWFVGIPVLLLLIAYIIFIFKVDKISRDRLQNNMKIYEGITAEKAHKEQEMIGEKKALMDS